MKKSFVFLASAALLANAPLAVLAQEAESNNPESSVVESGSDESVSNEDTPVEGEETPGEESTENEESAPTEGEESAPTEGEESTEESTPTEGEENPGEGEETPTEGEENPGEGEETPNEGEELPDPDAWDITEDQSLYTYPTTYDNFQEADEQAIAIALQGIQFEGKDIASRYRVAKNDETGLYEITFVIDAPEGTYEYEIDASGNVVVEAVESEVPGEEEETSSEDDETSEEETSSEDDETSEEESSEEDDETSEEESSEEDDETSEEESSEEDDETSEEENEDDEEPVNTDSFDRASWKSILTQLSDITEDEFENLSDEDYVRAILAVNERDGKVEPQKLVDYLKAEHPDAFADASETPNEEEEEETSNEDENSNEEETSNEDEENTDEEKDAEEQLEEEAAKVVEDNKKVEVKESVEGRPELPETGESRTPLLTTIGASLLALGSAILVKFRKKEEA